MIDMLDHFDILNKEFCTIMQKNCGVEILPGDRIIVLDACDYMYYYFGVVKEVCVENMTRLFAKTEKIKVADMPECATAQKWKEDKREECKAFLEKTERTPKERAHPKSMWILVEFKIRAGQTKKKRLYFHEILQLQKENRLAIIQPDKLK